MIFSSDLYDPYIERIQALNLQEFIEESSEFGLDIHSQLILVNQLREEVMNVVIEFSFIVVCVFVKVSYALFRYG